MYTSTKPLFTFQKHARTCEYRMSIITLLGVLSGLLLSPVPGGRGTSFPPLLRRSCSEGGWCISSAVSARSVFGCCFARASPRPRSGTGLPLVLHSAFEPRRVSCLSPTPYSFAFLAPRGSAVAVSSGGACTGCGRLVE